MARTINRHDPSTFVFIHTDVPGLGVVLVPSDWNGAQFHAHSETYTDDLGWFAADVKITGREPQWRRGDFWLRIRLDAVNGEGYVTDHVGGWLRTADMNKLKDFQWEHSERCRHEKVDNFGCFVGKGS